MANSNKRKNTIDSLLIDGTISTNSSDISKHIVKFYKELFTDQCSWRPVVDSISYDSIVEVKASLLEREFVDREVWEVVKEMNSNKAPGPNGYSMAFFQACWIVLKEDIMKVFHEFRTSGKFEKSLNATFLDLIPKIPEAVNPKDFRPINLVCSIDKIIAKILAIRL